MTDEPFIPVLAVHEGDEAAQARTHAEALVESVIPVVGDSMGWQAVAGMSATMLFRELATRDGFTTEALISGLGSALANTFAVMTPLELRQFVRGLEEEAAYQFAVKATHLRVMEPGGEA
jgi:hypothetical protein